MKRLVAVYISEVTDIPHSILPPYTDENKITNKSTLMEKRSAYSLLCRAVKKEYGMELEASRLTKTENGKPKYPGICFSISHKKELCAVALSKDDVGIDIEEEISGERAYRIKKMVLHKNEAADSDITDLWTKKEAIFKLLGGKAFIPSEIDTGAYHTDTQAFYRNGKRYTVSIAAHNECEIKIENG